MLKYIFVSALLGSALLAQQQSGNGSGNGTPLSGAPAPTQQGQTLPPPRPGDDLSQMRLDLDRMDGLLNNMSSEIEFLHDQNLQILLRTNSQMWTILIRDMRARLAREEQHRAADVDHSPEAPATPAPKPAKR